MTMFLSNNILWIKALHVISVIAWMSGMFYLPRLFVYHTETEPGSAASERFKVMERRLLRAIINPSMIATWVFGLTLVWLTAAYKEHWLQMKFLLVIAMSGLHGYFAGRVKAFAQDRNDKPARFYRILNEVPPILMVFIVILVIVQPF
ncbi:MAG TPA: protoporphyrinogen oxidase HemJ [Rhizomicrobium sp.]|jgi:putative membrane protein|nr:protoporphyrinogen oxidase HemJ [Rhizomicrobium sp.]